jgi:hypothetical protein
MTYAISALASIERDLDLSSPPYYLARLLRESSTSQPLTITEPEQQ